METQQILILIALAFAAGAGAGYTFPKGSKSTNEAPKQIMNQARFDEAKGVASLWGYELILTESSRHSSYVCYNVYKDGMKIGWSNSTADTTEELYYNIAEKCKSYFPLMEEQKVRLDKLIVDKKIELLKESKKEI
jgi:hypothetical protein